MLRQLDQHEGSDNSSVEVEKLKRLEVTGRDRQRQVPVSYPVQVPKRLPPCRVQVPSGAFLLHDEFGWQKHIDEALALPRQLYRVLEVTTSPTTIYSEDLKELRPEALRFALFIRFVSPVRRKMCRAGRNLVP